MTTSSVPDGISFSDLQALAIDAPEDTAAPQGLYDGLTQDELVEFVDKIINDTNDTCNHPMLAKTLLVDVLTRLIAWHSSAGLEQSEEDENKSAMYWHRDAGKLQAALCILHGVSMGPDDFLTE